MKKKVVLVINPSSEMGGAEISLMQTLKLTKNLFEYCLLLPENGTLIEIANEYGIRSKIIKWSNVLLTIGETNKQFLKIKLFPASFLFVFLLIKILFYTYTLKPSIIISNGIKCHIITALISYFYRGKIIWYVRDVASEKKISGRLLKFMSGRINTIIAVSNTVKTDLEEKLKVMCEVKMIYNVVDTLKFNPNTKPAIDLPLKKNEIWFCVVGALTHLKGQDIFIEASKIVLEKYPETKFFIIGSNLYRTESGGEYANGLRELVDCSLKFKSNFYFLGWRKDIEKVLSSMDVLVQPNRGPEAFGRSVVEAMALGKAVIVVNKWGPLEVVKDFQNGLLFEHNDIKDLAEKMILLITNPLMRNSLGRNAYAHILKYFSKDDHIYNFTETLSYNE